MRDYALETYEGKIEFRMVFSFISGYVGCLPFISGKLMVSLL